MEEVKESLLDAFRTFDKDSSGRLERGEIVEALNNLTLGTTKLTPREVRMVMLHLDEDESGTIEYNDFAPLMFDYRVEAFKSGFLQSEESDLAAYLNDHLFSYDHDQDGCLSRNQIKSALAEADLINLTPIQIHTILADLANIDPHSDSVEIATFANPAARLITKMSDPQLENKRRYVSQMAKVTPLGALTPDERKRLAELAGDLFKNYDNDGSGKLDRVEFYTCLKESMLGFNDQQISALMYAADADDDGNIDYGEFNELFDGVILEMARLDKIDKLIEGEEAGTLSAQLKLFLDELMIPLHLAFDFLCGGGESASSGAVVQTLLEKCPEWGVLQEPMNAICEAVLARGGEDAMLSWPQLVEEIEKLAVPAE